MANNLSSLKRIRQDAKKRLRNRYYRKTTRTAIARLRAMDNADEAEKSLPRVYSLIDQLAKRNIWHANKAANVKSGVAKHIGRLRNAPTA